jgi:hypothetical protein
MMQDVSYRIVCVPFYRSMTEEVQVRFTKAMLGLSLGSCFKLKLADNIRLPSGSGYHDLAGYETFVFVDRFNFLE